MGKDTKGEYLVLVVLLLEIFRWYALDRVGEMR